MFEIKDKIIKITKGDSAAIKVALKSIDGSDYTMVSGDTLKMTVRKKPESSVLMQITSTSNTINLTPALTSGLEVGRCCYDIQLTTSAGEIFTVVGMTDSVYYNMIVYPEVTV